MSAPQYTDIWPLIQRDILGVLLADEFIGARPGVLLEPGDMQSAIDAKITKVIGKGSDGKAGLGFLVYPIERAEDEDISNPFGPLKLQVKIDFVENVTINQGQAGTRIPIRIFTARAAKVLKLYTPVGLTQSLVASTPVIGEFTDDTNKALRVGTVDFYAREADAFPLVRLYPRPAITIAGDAEKIDDLNWQVNGNALVTVTQTKAVAIYYTTDGSHPYAGNPQAKLYTDPVSVTEACLFRARAFGDETDLNTIGSDTSAINFV